VARGSEVLGERWTLIVVRNLLNGATTFNEIAGGCPGMSRSLLAGRLHELQRAGVITINPKRDGRGYQYEMTTAGRQLRPVLDAVADWAENWVDVTADQADPAVVLWSLSRSLVTDLLPQRRTVVRFDFENHRGKQRNWLLIEHREGEICLFDPGFGDDLVIVIHSPLPFARWHLGQVTWAELLRSEAINLTGPQVLRRAFPTWNGTRTFFVDRRNTAQQQAAYA
jgi:DNA-binding HxlR family transcriptional regulator